MCNKVPKDSLIADWGDAKVASDEPKNWNPAAMGNILGSISIKIVICQSQFEEYKTGRACQSAGKCPSTPTSGGVHATGKRVRCLPSKSAKPIHENWLACFPLKFILSQKFDSSDKRDNKNTLSGKPKNSEFTFMMDQESAQKNMCVLKKYNYDLKAALAAQKDSPLTYGSEFKLIDVLEPVFGLHPNWRRKKSILKHGSCWPLKDLLIQRH